MPPSLKSRKNIAFELYYVHNVIQARGLYETRSSAMTSRPTGLRLPEDLKSEIERERRMRSITFSAAVISLLREALRMRRVPGVHFVEGFGGTRRAAIAGTGLEIWEVVRTYREVGEDYERLKDSYPWLSDLQLRAALSYYELYPEEIDERIEAEESWTPERLGKEMPFAVPRLKGEARAPAAGQDRDGEAEAGGL